MELDLEKLKRDWIDGISGSDFLTAVEIVRTRLKSLSEPQRCQGVAIGIEDPTDFACAFFAAVSLEIPVVLVNPRWQKNEWSELQELVAPAVVFGELPIAGSGNRSFPIAAGSILIPTGGTTGGIKLARHDWASLAVASAGVQAFLGGGSIDSCCLLPLYHVSGLMQLVRSFLSGGRIRFNNTEVAGYCLSLVPTQLQRLLCDPDSIEKLNTTRAIFVGGAALPAAVADKARAHQLPILPVYGMTETAAMCAAVPSENFLENPAAGAVPIGNTKFIVESDGRIRIQTDSLFKGYQGSEPLDLSQGYLTEDLGRLDPCGHLQVQGRADRILISGGEKIDPLEVEQALCQLAGVEGVLVVGLPDTEWGQALVAFCTGSEIQDWKPQLQARLTYYKMPKRLIWVDRLPLDAKGKPDHASLKKYL